MRSEITIIIPCFNERKTVLEVLRLVTQLRIQKEVIVIDNCSTDGTRELLRSKCMAKHAIDVECAELQALSATHEVLVGAGFFVVFQQVNRQKGGSVKLGLRLARGEYFVCQDADLEYDPSDLVKLLAHARKTNVPAVFGSRRRLGNPIESKSIQLHAFHLGRVALTWLFRLLYRSSITDVATCYKLMRTDVARELELDADGFELDFEIPAKLRINGHSISELPVSFLPRTHDQGKKIRGRDGLAAVWVMARLWPRFVRRMIWRPGPSSEGVRRLRA